MFDRDVVPTYEHEEALRRLRRCREALRAIRTLALRDVDELTARHALHLYASDVLRLCDEALEA